MSSVKCKERLGHLRRDGQRYYFTAGYRCRDKPRTLCGLWAHTPRELEGQVVYDGHVCIVCETVWALATTHPRRKALQWLRRFRAGQRRARRR